MNDTDFWTDGLRILCVRLDNMGDVLMTTPAIRALKTTWPNCHLTLLTSSVGAAIGDFIPEIDQIIPFDVPWVSGTSEQRDSCLSMVSQLEKSGFDAAILFTVQSQNPLPAALLCYMAGIPRVLGYCRENPYQLITDWLPDTEVLVANRHEVERQLALVQAVGCQTNQHQLSLDVPLVDQVYIRKYLASRGLDFSRPWFVLHPGVSEARRRYPADEFAKAAKRLVRTAGYQAVLTGSPSEQPLIDVIQQELGGQAINLAGQLNLGQLIALIADAPILVANNTGPVHIAAAVGTPVVVLYAKTNPQHTPWRVPNRVLYFDVPAAIRSRNVLLQQFPDGFPSDASPDAIVQAVLSLLDESVNANELSSHSSAQPE
ncbi:lipopolysaccharide heptosyltransferase II [Spirosoma gilvum]